MSAAIEKPDILGLFIKEGIKFWQRGRLWWAYCPLHSDKTPSFCINPEKQSFKCYGCGKYGDSIDFVRAYKGLSFKDALSYLGITGDTKPIKPNPVELKKRKLVKKFQRWEQLYRRAICELLRLVNRIDLAIKTLDGLELPGIAEMYFKKFIYEYHLDILNGNNDREKFELFKEWAYGNVCVG